MSHSKNKLKAIHTEMMNQVFDFVGDDTQLAEVLDIAKTNVTTWKNRKRISKHGAKLIGDHPILGEHFSAVDIRPELDISNKHMKVLELIEYAGGAAQLAKMLNVTLSRITHWRTKGNISPKGIILVENHEELGIFFTASDFTD